MRKKVFFAVLMVGFLVFLCMENVFAEEGAVQDPWPSYPKVEITEETKEIGFWPIITPEEKAGPVIDAFTITYNNEIYLVLVKDGAKGYLLPFFKIIRIK